MELKSLLFNCVKFFLFSIFILGSPNLLASSGELQWNQNSKPTSFVNQNLKLSNYIKFKVVNIDLKNKIIKLNLQTQENFKLYSEKLKFIYQPQSSLPFELNYESEIKPHIIFDKFSNENKKVFENSNNFKITGMPQINEQDEIHIQLQACSVSVCFNPSTLKIKLLQDAVSLEMESNNNGIEKPLNTQIVNSVPSKEQTPILSSADNVDSQLSLFLKNALINGSLILFPALFLAGLLMNLTPCVYPMIPITLSVLSQFQDTSDDLQKRKRNQLLLPCIYVGAMVVVYSCLGVFAGMTGNLFGAQLSNPIFSSIMALFMFVFGLAMLGYFNLSFLQTFANKIPLAKNNPILAVATMGAVSGLVSAPCTGPVLSMILVLIAQSKNPFSGFLYMMFFSLGFGAPYVILGFLSQKIMKMPKFPRLVELMKLFFASFMFALALYFLKPILTQWTFFHFLYFKPASWVIILNLTLICVFVFNSTKKNKFGKISRIFAVVTLFFMCLWVTLKTTTSFVENSKSNLFEINSILKSSPIHWTTDFQNALILSQKEHKPIIVDIWANWCVACLEMEKTTWKNESIVQFVNNNYIAVKLDYSNSGSQEINDLIDKWNIVGLPAVILFSRNANKDSAPSHVQQGILTSDGLIEILKKNL